MAKYVSGRKPRRGEYLWCWLCGRMGALYAAISRAWPGRMMLAYRRAEGSLLGGDPASPQEVCRPVSPARRRLMETMEKSFIARLVKGLFALLWRCPLMCYGLLGLFYTLGFTGNTILRTILFDHTWPVSTWVLCGVLMAVSVLLMTARCSLGEALGRSPVARLLLVHYLCIPSERLTRTSGWPMSIPVGALSGVLGIGMAVMAVYGDLSVVTLPLVLLLLGVWGMIFASPEAGVLLSTALLPFVWLDHRSIYLLCGLIIVTWCAYGIKLMYLHRTWRMGLLDRVILLFGGYMLVTAFLGVSRTPDTVALSLIPVVLLADYFLIVNLMTSRAYIRRCLLGVAASVVIVTALAYLSRVPMDTLDWLTGSRAGDAIVIAFREAVESLSGLWQEHAEIYLVLVFPWLFAYLMHTRLPTRRVMALVMLTADLGLILMTRSITATVCVVVVTVLFILLLGPKWATAGLVSLPVTVVGALFLVDRFPVSEAFRITLSRSRHFKEQLRDSLWRMTVDHPAGIGAGEDAFATVYPAYAAPDLGAVTESGSLFFEILLAYGWPGFLLLCAVVFLFLQKGFTCLAHTAARRDRAMLFGGLVSVCGILVFGIFRNFLTVPRVFFTITLVVALTGAYENILFSENDVLMATEAGSITAQDRIYRCK